MYTEIYKAMRPVSICINEERCPYDSLHLQVTLWRFDHKYQEAKCSTDLNWFYGDSVKEIMLTLPITSVVQILGAGYRPDGVNSPGSRLQAPGY